ncbi:MAG: RNA polymerase sigma factor SigM [Dietzia sp.]|uniref:RNA polymerase sigma factor SigM n=1 Tax=Dietzia cercidiphylli TaxID=498199 RepID=A0ABN2JAC0_9ACTN|nr:RNA polymerase sigma factor SigM [Dietzia sp.]MBB1046818.1 RNA polymerase sigma factor SigM [Dietzia cercidiphylli]MDO8395195.1 RNA polymerase sigma factor SigM [Dietzia sp.]
MNTSAVDDLSTVTGRSPLTAGSRLTAGSALSDVQLLDAHIAGDPDAFSALVRRHYDYLWRLAIRTSFNREDAAEALQDALISAYRKADSFRHACPVQGWLYRIVVNACLDKMRSQRLRTHSELTPRLHEEISLRDHFYQDPAYAIIVAEALAELPTDQRDAVVVVDMLRCTVAEACHLLNARPGTIKSRCSRGRAKLSVLLAGVTLTD